MAPPAIPLEDRYVPEPNSGCWLWLGGMKKRLGYGLAKSYPKEKLAHTWVYEQLVGPIPEGLELDHLCRNRLCVNPEHLEPVTSGENQRRGIHVKLSHQKVAEIKKLVAEGYTQKEVAFRFGVHQSVISRVMSGESWGTP